MPPSLLTSGSTSGTNSPAEKRRSDLLAGSPYQVDAGRLCYIHGYDKETGAPKLVPLANFVALPQETYHDHSLPLLLLALPLVLLLVFRGVQAIPPPRAGWFH